MFLFIAAQFIAFPERKDSLLSTHKSNVEIEASGSLGLFLGDSQCHQTYPNQTIVGDENMDWCSNIQKSDEMPWISYSIKNKAIKLQGYSIRNGCCHYYCCCDSETGEVFDYECCCRLYSFSLLGSNDKTTWKVIHQVVKEPSLFRCEFKTYEFSMTQSFKYIRLVMGEPRPGYLKCLQINQIEFYGTTFDTLDMPEIGSEENEESISIIGKIRKE